MNRVVRAGIGANKDTGKYVSKVDEDEGRTGSKTIKNQLSKSTKRKDREEYDNLVAEERMKTVVAFSKKRPHSSQNDSDSDDDMDSKSAMTAKSSSKASSTLNSLFDSIGVNADDIRKQEADLEAKRQKNREQRAAKKARKRASNQEEVVPVKADPPPTNVRLNLGAIGGDVAVTIYDHEEKPEPAPVKPVAVAEAVVSDSADDEADTEAADTSLGAPVERSAASADADSDEEDEEDNEDDAELLKRLVKRPTTVLNINTTKKVPAPAKPAPAKKAVPAKDNQSQDRKGKNGKVFERKVGTGSFRFAHLPADQRPTHGEDGKRLKYTKDGRIKSSKRSKQKNIKKDNRPDHLKPSGAASAAVEINE